MIEEALINELKENYIKAVEIYEKAIEQKTIVDIDSFINLSFIYWSFVDYGFSSYYCISNSLRDFGAIRYSQILKKGIKLYPNSLELHFWSKYYQHRHLGVEFTETNCLKLIENYDNDSLVPYFFLYLFDNKKYKEQRDKLLLECKNLPTAKNRYIISIIQ